MQFGHELSHRNIEMKGVFLALLGAAFLVPSTVTAQRRDLPKEFQQILPRGGIAAVNDPVFVPASEAKLSDDAWVLGIVIDGEARAFSLKLLNNHEVVNDEIGDTAYAAVW